MCPAAAWQQQDLLLLLLLLPGQVTNELGFHRLLLFRLPLHLPQLHSDSSSSSSRSNTIKLL
jgi:hypothetical protein